MSEELKPCPFCGSSDVTIGTNYRGENSASYYAFCRTCKADTRGFPSKETTLNEWNTRAYEAEIEALKERLTDYEDACRQKQEIIDGYKADVAEYRDALDHITRLGYGSRTQTKRIVYITKRAESALTFSNKWREFPKPSEVKNWFDLRREIESLKQQLSVALEQLKLAYAFCKGLDGEEKFHADKLGEAIQQIQGKREL